MLLTGTAADGFNGTINGQPFTSLNLILAGSASTDSLQGLNAAATWNLGSIHQYSSLGRTLGFSGFEALQGGSGNDAFVFANGTVFPGSIDGGAGSDTLNFAAYTTARSVLLTGLGSTDGFDGSEASLTGGFANIDAYIGSSALTDTLTGRDVPTTWNINGANTYSNGANTLSFSGVEILVGGSAADTFIITGAQAFSLHGGAGNDSFLFNNGASLTGSLDGGSGTDTLDFSAYATARSVILTGADATGFSGTQPAISGGFTGIDVLVGSAATNDNLTGTNAASTWTIGAADTYRTGTATLDFSGYENLLGGSGNDTFAFTGSGSVKGTVNGGLGTNWLDYSLYGSGVHVNLFSSPVTVGTAYLPGAECHRHLRWPGERPAELCKHHRQRFQ